MQIGNFSVTIGKGVERESGYVDMQHNTEYTIELRNMGSEDANAQISIDGVDVGTFRVERYDRQIIKRPSHIARNFLFLKLGTPEAEQANLQANSDLGLITVKFIPAKQERQFELLATKSITFRGGAKGASAGGTGLGSNSDQEFVSAKHIDLDHSRAVIINLRLVAIPDIIPLKPLSNPVPPSLL